MSHPVTAFTISGHLVAVDQSRIEIYRMDRKELRLESACESPGRPLAVMPVRHGEFAILDASGSRAKECGVWKLKEPKIFDPLKLYDLARFKLGLPHGVIL